MRSVAFSSDIISIHALVKRATGLILIISFLLSISIHALVKRATSEWWATLVTALISIHALVKRATGWGAAVKGQPPNFNPRPRKEGDPSFPPHSDGYENFNPRPRKEGDILHRQAFAVRIAISIHALVKRATNTYSHLYPREEISIHALVKRATQIVCRFAHLLNISIHALVKRATWQRLVNNCHRGRFQSTPS